jgi:hypothetical protein
MKEQDSHGQEVSEATALTNQSSPASEEVRQNDVGRTAISQAGEQSTPRKSEDRTAQAAKDNKVTPDTSQMVSEVAQAIRRLEDAAISYRNRENTGFHLILLATFASTFIAGANLLHKQQVDFFGGWVLFCVVVILLSAAAGALAAYIRATNPGRNKDRCLKFRTTYKKLTRALQAQDLTPTKFFLLRKKLANLGSQAGEYLLAPSKPWAIIAFFEFIVAVIVTYFLLVSQLHVTKFEASPATIGSTSSNS